LSRTLITHRHAHAWLAAQVALRKNPLATSSTAQHEAHRGLAAAIDACQAAVHAAFLDNIDTATALDEALSAQPKPLLARSLLLARLFDLCMPLRQLTDTLLRCRAVCGGSMWCT
jgi:hypothetical protein